jgi:hypothetical protein
MGSDQTARQRVAPPPPDDRRLNYIRFLAFVLAILGLLLLAVSMARFLSSMGWGFDFQAYLAAAQRLARGDPIYQQYSLDGPFRPGPYGLYLYSPPFAVATLPFTMISQQAAEMLWFVLRVGLLVAACAVMPVRPPWIVTGRCRAFATAMISWTSSSLAGKEIESALPVFRDSSRRKSPYSGLMF